MVTETMTNTRKLPTIIVGLILVVALSWIQSSFAQQKEGQSDQLSATTAKSTKRKAQRTKKRNTGSQRRSGNHPGRTSKGQRPRKGKSCEEPTKAPLFCSQ
jgi:hypothetical protein